MRVRSWPSTFFKSIKGVAIGFLSALIVGLALFWLTPFELWQTALFTIAIIGAGIMGDIVVNSIKKSLGNKGWESEMYIGRGVLERFAPLIFSAPVFYHLALIYFSIAG
jgi:phosphatidate cytidylyltransferase